jgi:probable rRNA maturation factor
MKLFLVHEPEVETPFRDELLLSIYEKTISKIGLFEGVQKNIHLGVAAVSEVRIQELNREYRGKDKVTDILSFGDEWNYIEQGSIPEGDELMLGDLIYNPAYIIEAAKEDGVSLEHEMAFIFSHGILHLLGYDHSEEMFALQDQVTEELTATDFS